MHGAYLLLACSCALSSCPKLCFQNLALAHIDAQHLQLTATPAPVAGLVRHP